MQEGTCKWCTERPISCSNRFSMEQYYIIASIDYTNEPYGFSKAPKLFSDYATLIVGKPWKCLYFMDAKFDVINPLTIAHTF